MKCKKCGTSLEENEDKYCKECYKFMEEQLAESSYYDNHLDDDIDDKYDTYESNENIENNKNNESYWEMTSETNHQNQKKSEFDDFFSKISNSDSPLADEISKKNNEKKRKIVIIGGSIVAILIFVIVFFSSGLYESFLSPRMRYLKSESKNAQTLYTSASKAIKEIYQRNVTNLQNSPYEDTKELNFKIDTPLNVENTKRLVDFFNKSNIKISTSADDKNKASFTNFILNNKTGEVINFKVLNNNNQITLGVDNIHKKYYYADLTNPKAFVERFGIDANSIPEKLIDKNDVLNAISINEETLKAIAIRYGEIYASSLKDANVTMGETVQKSIGGQAYSCKKIKISLSNFEIHDIYNKIFNSLKSDRELYGLFEKNALAILNLYSNSNSKILDQYKNIITFEKYQNFIEDNFSKNILTTENVTGKVSEFDLNMDVYINEDGDIVSRDIDIIDRLASPDSSKPNYNTKIKIDSLNGSNKFLTNVDFTIWKGTYKFNYAVDTLKEDSVTQEKVYSSSVDYKEITVDPNDKNSIKKLVLPLSAKLNIKNTNDSTNKKSNGEYSIMISSAAKKIYSSDLEINIKRELKTLNEFKATKFNEKDIFDLNKAKILDIGLEYAYAKKDFVNFLNKREDIRRIFIDIVELFQSNRLSK